MIFPLKYREISTNLLPDERHKNLKKLIPVCLYNMVFYPNNSSKDLISGIAQWRNIHKYTSFLCLEVLNAGYSQGSNMINREVLQKLSVVILL